MKSMIFIAMSLVVSAASAQGGAPALENQTQTRTQISENQYSVTQRISSLVPDSSGLVTDHIAWCDENDEVVDGDCQIESWSGVLLQSKATSVERYSIEDIAAGTFERRIAVRWGWVCIYNMTPPLPRLGTLRMRMPIYQEPSVMTISTTCEKR